MSTVHLPAGVAPSHEADGGHPEHLAHHFATPAQQVDAGKLGMWLFLGTEILLFAGLFCVYAVLRANHPAVFAYGHRFLDVRWGAVNTIVLISSSFTMAMAVSAAQRGQRRQLVWFLQLTFLGGLGFLGIKYIEYSHKFDEGLVWGKSFYEKPDWIVAMDTLERAEATLLAEHAGGGAALAPGDVALGQNLWNGVCRSCHGPAGEGLPNEGKEIAGGEFVTSRTDEELLAFVKVGRKPNDPANTMKKEMPAKGGNPLLSDQDLMHIIAFLRSLPAPAAGDAAAGGAQAAATEFWMPRSAIPNAAAGPAGLGELPAATVEHAHNWPHHSVDPARPEGAHLFFGTYFLMTGLHGLHVLIGMAVLAWLIVRAARGHFSTSYYTPVDLGGLYWHLVDLIWIYLFPLLYLIE